MNTNGNDKFPIDCPHCGQRFSVQIPPIEIVNTGRTSLAITAHPKPVKCICGGSCVLMVTSTQFAWAVQGITEQQASKLDGSNIIVAAPKLGLVG